MKKRGGTMHPIVVTMSILMVFYAAFLIAGEQPIADPWNMHDPVVQYYAERAGR